MEPLLQRFLLLLGSMLLSSALFFWFKMILFPNLGMLSSDMGGLYAGTVDNL